MSQDRSNNMESDFQLKLSGFEMNPPMEVLERIHQKRTFTHQILLLFKRRWPVYIAVLLNLLAIAGYLSGPVSVYEINALPIPLHPTATIAQPSIPATHESTSAIPSVTRPETVVMEETKTSTKRAALSPTEAPNQQKGTPESFGLTPKQQGEIHLHDIPLRTIANQLIRNGIGTKVQVKPLPALQLTPISPVYSLVKPAVVPEQFALSTFPILKPANQASKLSPSLALEFGASTFIPIRQLEAFNESYQPYLDLRKNTESPKLGFSQQILLDIGLENGIHLKTGLALSTVVDDFYYFNDTEKQLVINEVKAPDGSILRADTSYVSGVVAEQSNNRTHSLDIPILISYQTRWKKFDFGIQTGTYLNLDFWQNGQTIDSQTLRPVAFQKASHAQSIRKIGGNYFASIRFGYVPSNKWSLHIEPQVRYYPNFFNDPSYVLKQKFWWPGISIGTRMQLN